MRQCRFVLLVALAMVLSATFAFATDDGNFSIGIATGLPATDNFVNLSNSGASWGSFLANGTLANGNLCANVYVFSFDEQEVACCACRITPNALKSYSVLGDLVNNPLTGAPYPNKGAIIKIIATAAPGFTCDPTLVEQTDIFGVPLPGAQYRASGLLAWQRRGSTSDIPFVSSTLSKPELTRAVLLCQNIVNNGSGHGICNICRNDGE